MQSVLLSACLQIALSSARAQITTSESQTLWRAVFQHELTHTGQMQSSTSAINCILFPNWCYNAVERESHVVQITLRMTAGQHKPRLDSYALIRGLHCAMKPFTSHFQAWERLYKHDRARHLFTSSSTA